MHLLEVNNLSLGYGSETIFSNIDIQEDSGKIIALLGSNGRGKSTLLRTLAGLEPIFSGEIFYDSVPLKKMNREQMSSMVSFVAPTIQKTEYLSVEGMLSINTYHRTNWLGTLTEKEKERIAGSLDRVGLQGFLQRECNSLSDGEYQRVTIAGALVQDSKIILLDEPTAFLDIANKFLISRLLKQIAHSENKLVIFSTHDLRLAMEICDKLWVMTPDGFFTGTPSELSSSSNDDSKCVIERMFNVSGVHFDPKIKSFILSEDED